MASAKKNVDGTYVTLNKDGKAVWEPGLGAEVTARERPKFKRAEKEEKVTCDLKATLKMTPAERAEWLEKALSGIPKGLAKPQEVFDIVTHKKFPEAVPASLGEAMLKNVRESMMFFTDKQRLTIAKSQLVKDFKNMLAGKRKKEADSDSDKSSGDEAETRRTRHDRGRSSESRSRPRKSGKDAEERPREDERREESPTGGMSPEERAQVQREFEERQRDRELKRQEELAKIEADRKAREERERQRKAKIGNAFVMDGDDEDEPLPPALLRPPVLDKLRADDRGDHARSSSSRVHPVNTAAVAVMGGDGVVAEAQRMLQAGAGDFLKFQQEQLSKPPKRGKSRKRSRSRRKKRRSPSSSSSPPRAKQQRVDPHQRRSRAYDSLRSPTPDGHLRGQMRNARKAKLMAQMLQQGNVPRVS